MKPVDVIIPTVGQVYKTSHPYTCFSRLHYIPTPINIHIVTGGKTWGEAINIGLAQSNKENDVILMDDDVFIDGQTFKNFDNTYDKGEIFGFRLLYPNGTIQHAGGITDGEMIGHIGYMEQNESITKEPYYVCHATTSLIYIKRRVIDLLGGISTDIPGTQFDDVDFNFRAIKAGFRILQLSNEAIHIESATKATMPGFKDKMNIAFEEIKKRYFSDKEFVDKLKQYPIPMIKTLEVA